MGDPLPAGPIVNIAAYQFVPLDGLEQRRTQLRDLCRDLDLKGTILLTPEGINLFLAGSRESIDAFTAQLRGEEGFRDIEIKESFSDRQPFERLLVKIKEEIIAFGVPGIDPIGRPSRRIQPQVLRDWLASGKEVVLLDVRNDYEVNIGTFENAHAIGVRHFRDFPKAVAELPETYRDAPLVMFCTGGVRCEKAGPFLDQAGFREVYQLHGGILKYFEEVGGEFYQGDCFVFDDRVALNPQLEETQEKQCYACRTPLSVEDQQSELYDPPHACPHCHATPEEKQRRLLAERHQRLHEATAPLPGSVPYDNPRPLNVQGRFDRMTLLEFVSQYHPHISLDEWKTICAEGRIRQNGAPVSADRIVRSGEQFAHLHPATVEPDVNASIEILHEDDALVVVNKPAPLPTHPCGRFNRNSLQWILNAVYAPLKLRPAHRLDANTTGIVILGKNRQASAALQSQFVAETVHKEYCVRVQGAVPWESHLCEEPISRDPVECGGRTVSEDGLPSRTRFERVQVFPDGTTLLRAMPETGRTNQIRVHLWQLGFPVCGDPLYLPGRQLGNEQTRSPGEPMCLHARRISFRHPLTEEQTAFETPWPAWSEQGSPG